MIRLRTIYNRRLFFSSSRSLSGVASSEVVNPPREEPEVAETEFTPKKRLFRMYAVLGMTGLGIFAGFNGGKKLADWLGPDQLDLFTYVPEDDDDDAAAEGSDDKGEMKGQDAAAMTRSVFGDHRFTISFNWKEYDGTVERRV